MRYITIYLSQSQKSLSTTQNVSVSRTIEDSCDISLLIAECGKNHTIGGDLIKPTITAFQKAVLEKHENTVKAMPLNNITDGK